MRWKTDDMVKLVQSICDGLADKRHDVEFKVSSSGPGGDWDTDWVYVHYYQNKDNFLKQLHSDDVIQFFGFNTGEKDRFNGNASDVDAEYIELSSLHASSGAGVETDFEDLMTLAYRLRKELINRGWIVVNSMKNYY